MLRAHCISILATCIALSVSTQVAAQTPPGSEPTPAEAPDTDPTSPQDADEAEVNPDESSTDPETSDSETSDSEPQDNATADEQPTEPTQEPAEATAQPEPVEPEPVEPEAVEPAVAPPPTVESESTVPLAEEPTATYEASPPAADPPRPPSPFRQGAIRVGAGIGWASTYSESWTILSAGAGVFVLDGLQVEFDSTFWVGGDPFVATLTPGLRYVLHFVPVVQPYVGTFYRHYFVDSGYSDTDSIGARAGVYFSIGKHVVIGGGAVYEHFLDDDLFTRRDDVYPELSIAFLF